MKMGCMKKMAATFCGISHYSGYTFAKKILPKFLTVHEKRTEVQREIPQVVFTTASHKQISCVIAGKVIKRFF